MKLAYDAARDSFTLDGKPCAIKQTGGGLLAVRRGGMWHYFTFTSHGYEKTGSTLALAK